jgi:dethiobiotin synthetase
MLAERSPGPPEADRPAAEAGASRGVFVTGTGTGVGKTVVAAVIARMASSGGKAVRVFKPAVTGLDDYPDREIESPEWASAPELPDHLLLRLAADSEQSDDQIAPHRYGPAVSPHLAAQLAGEPIQPAQLVATARAAQRGADYLVCEGVGGLMVPLAPDYVVRDLARELALPVLIAASPGLGTLNHTLLTIESARAVGLEVVGVVLTPWPEVEGEIERSNRETIARLGSVPVQTLRRLDLSQPATWPSL